MLSIIDVRAFWLGLWEIVVLKASNLCGNSSVGGLAFGISQMATASTPASLSRQLVSKTDRTRVEGANSRLRHHLAQLHRKTFCYSKSIEMLKLSLSLLLHYLKFRAVPVLV